MTRDVTKWFINYSPIPSNRPPKRYLWHLSRRMQDLELHFISGQMGNNFGRMFGKFLTSRDSSHHVPCHLSHFYHRSHLLNSRKSSLCVLDCLRECLFGLYPTQRPTCTLWVH